MNGRFSRNFATAVIVIIGVISCLGHAAYAAQYEASVLYRLLPPDGNPTEGLSVFSASNGMAVGEDTNSNPVAWTSSSGIGVSLNLPGYDLVYSFAIAGQYEVGTAISFTTGEIPVLWEGSASSAINMSPPGIVGASIENGDATQEIGSGSLQADGTNVGLLWTGTSPNAVLLGAPAGFMGGAFANGVGGNEQVGSGQTVLGHQHALLWSGSTASVVDLNPTGFTDSQAIGTDGTQQVGEGSVDGTQINDALLWYGTANSVVDLNPPGFSATTAIATNGSEQVGNGASIADDGNDHALLWSGSADSVVDLSDLLPSDGDWFAQADSIDADGNVFGWASGSYQGVFGIYLIEWSPVSEPAEASFLALALILGLRHPTRRSAANR